MTEAVVHIGFHKCGSTAIQRWLAENRAALAGMGIAFRRTDPRPDVICSNPQFLDLAFSEAGLALPKRPMTEVLGYQQGDLDSQMQVTGAFAADYAAWARQHGKPVTVISNEFLASWLSTPQLIAALDTWLKRRFGKVRYIVYIRRPQDWVVSRFGHSLREGASDLALDEFILRHGHTRFAAHLRNWIAVAGKDRLDLRLFEEDWLNTKGLVQDFCQALSADPARLKFSGKRENTSFTPQRGLRRWLALWRHRSARLLPRPALTDRQRSRIDLQNADDMAWIADTFFSANPERFRAWACNEISPSEQKA